VHSPPATLGCTRVAERREQRQPPGTGENGEDPYAGSTDENTDNEDHPESPDLPIPELPGWKSCPCCTSCPSAPAVTCARNLGLLPILLACSLPSASSV
jgi:hypothetical protein